MSKIVGVTVGTPMHPVRAAEAGAAVRYTAQALTEAQKTQARDNIGAASVEAEIPYIVGNSAEAGVWTGTCDKITEYREGLTILYKTNVAGVSGGSTLDINNLGAVAVCRNASTAVTTIYPAGTVLMLTYSSDKWLTADYDANTKTSSGTSNKEGTKMFLVGGTSQSSSGVTTYTNKSVYIGTDNCLYSNGKKVAHADEVPTAEQFSSLSGAVDGKLAKNQGAANVGKILVVGSDGNLTLTDMPEPGVAGDVVGTLDESNNILLSGDLDEGTYPLKWLLDDGTYKDAGTLTVALTPEPEPIINWITNSINADGTPFVGANGEKGYKTDTRLSTSAGTESTSSATGIETTGFIPAKTGDIMYIKGITISASKTTNALTFYNDKFEATKTAGANNTGVAFNYSLFKNGVNGELASVVLNAATVGNNNFNADVAYIRICADVIDSNSVITINQPIE